MKELLKPLQNPNLPSLPKDATELITEYLLAETTEENLRIGAVNLQGRNVKGRRANNLAQVEFYVAVKRLEARDGNGYRAGLEACLKVKGVDDVLIEQVIAFRELRAETTSKRAKSAKKR